MLHGLWPRLALAGYETPILPLLWPASLSHPLCISPNPFLPTDWFYGSLSASQWVKALRAVLTTAPSQPAALPGAGTDGRAPRLPVRLAMEGTGSGQVGKAKDMGQPFGR